MITVIINYSSLFLAKSKGIQCGDFLPRKPPFTITGGSSQA